jgi:hypothetical protein
MEHTVEHQTIVSSTLGALPAAQTRGKNTEASNFFIKKTTTTR